jgi:hypothetical protein
MPKAPMYKTVLDRYVLIGLLIGALIAAASWYYFAIQPACVVIP